MKAIKYLSVGAIALALTLGGLRLPSTRPKPWNPDRRPNQ